MIFTYIGYPALVYLVGAIFPKRIRKGNIEPRVTVLITAYNERRAIREKLRNTFEIDYPANKLEILVASDGSDDGTDEIVGEFSGEGVKLFHQEGRKGKTYTQNKAVEIASGEIVLFSDATTKYQPDVLREIIPNFADPSIGCVAGRLIYVDNSRSDVGRATKSYWNYESFLKRSESRACSIIGASGCLYAVRKSAYQVMYPEACSDFLICTVVYRQGLRSVYEPNAICSEETNRHSLKEMRMRIRVISQTFTDLWRNREMLNPLNGGFYSIQLIAHKVFRYAVPIFLMSILITAGALALSSTFFLVLFIVQLSFYAIALAGGILEKAGFRLGPFSIPLFFTVTNLASVIAFYKFLSGDNYASWEPIRETENSKAGAYTKSA